MYRVYAQGLAKAPFRIVSDRGEAVVIAARLAAQEGAAWVTPPSREGLAIAADRIYPDGREERWLLDDEGMLLGNGD